MADIERIGQVDGLYRGVSYTYGVIAPPGSRTVFLAGACPLDEDGGTVAVGDYTGQAAACLATMTLALTATGAGLGDVVFIRALVASTSQTDLAAVWGVVRAAFGPLTPPGTLMGVTVLGWPDQLVEIEAVAAIPSAR